MARNETRSLFDDADGSPADEAWPDAPLAERMRPRTWPSSSARAISSARAGWSAA